VLDPQIAQLGVGPAGQVACRHHPVGGEEGLVAVDPVAQGQARVGQPVHGRHHPDAHHHHVGLEGRPVGQLDPARAAVGRRDHAGHADPGAQGDAVAAVQGGAGRPDLGPEHR